MDLLDELQQRVLPGDGAMGTELLAAGVPAGRCLEELCVSQPDLVRGIHEQYIAAGARVIETNSFGANAVRLARHGLEGHVNEINWNAAQLAKDAAKGTGVYVAGSVGPLGITAGEATAQGIDRHAVFLEQIGALLDGGCNVIFLETFLDVDELLIACNAKQTLHHCPVVAMVAIDDPDRFTVAAEKLQAVGVEIIGINCVDTGHVVSTIQNSKFKIQNSLAAYPSAGLPNADGSRLVYSAPADALVNTAQTMPPEVRLIGGCCGMGPGHIKALAAYLEKNQPAR